MFENTYLDRIHLEKCYLGTILRYLAIFNFIYIASGHFEDDRAFCYCASRNLHCMHHPVIPESDLYFTFCSTLNALSKRMSK